MKVRGAEIVDGADVSDHDSGAASTRSTRSVRPERTRGFVLLAILGLAFVFYFWTGTSSGNPIKFEKQGDDYNQLATAFLHGHLGLLEQPPPGLTALEDPYDPAQNTFWQSQPGYHDLVLYKNHFYLTWGPTPVVTLLIPWRLLRVGDMPVNLAIIIYTCLGLLFAVLLLKLLIERYLARTKTWALALGAAALALGNAAPWILRRPAVYELAVSCGYCFAMLGAFLIVSGGFSPTPSRWRLLAGSTSIGLALCARPNLGFEVLLIVAALVYIERNESRTWRQSARFSALVLAPFAALLVLDLAYNYARFGSPFDNGAKYALVAGIEMSKLPMNSLRPLIPNLYYYALGAVRHTFAFPYFSVSQPPFYPGSVPHNYGGAPTAGLLWTTPILLALIPGVPFLFRQARRELRVILTTLIVIGVLVVVFLGVALPGTTMRYETDFATLFLIPALLAWYALLGGRGRRTVAILGTVLVVYGCIVGAAISVYGDNDTLRLTEPDVYWTLNRFSSALPTVVTMITGHPAIVRVLPADHYPVGNDGTYDIPHTPFTLSDAETEIDVVAPRSGHWSVAPTFRVTPGATHGPISIVIKNDNGDRDAIVIGTEPTGFPLKLHRGLNRIQLHATAANTKLVKGTALVNATGIRFSG